MSKIEPVDLFVEERITKETKVKISLSTSGSFLEGSTGVRFLDHMLSTFSTYSGLGLKLEVCESLDGIAHHLIEDVGIVFGRVFRKAFDYSKVKRYGEATVPMDEALVGAYVDLSGRPFFFKNFEFIGAYIEDFPTEVFEEFMKGFSNNAKITVHFVKFSGRNEHHVIEACFKAFGLAIRKAVQPSQFLSTKGMID